MPCGILSSRSLVLAIYSGQWQALLLKITPHPSAILAILLAKLLFQLALLLKNHEIMREKYEYGHEYDEPQSICQYGGDEIDDRPGNVHWISADGIGAGCNQFSRLLDIHGFDRGDCPGNHPNTNEQERPSEKMTRPSGAREPQRAPDVQDNSYYEQRHVTLGYRDVAPSLLIHSQAVQHRACLGHAIDAQCPSSTMHYRIQHFPREIDSCLKNSSIPPFQR